MRRSIVNEEKSKKSDALRIAAEEETRTDRTNFPDAIKAEVYARDRAICAFTGMNLWLLDEGIGGFYNTCFIDHVVPSTKGGKSIADNAVATFAAYNYNKGANIGANLYLFIDGLPTFRFWQYYRHLPIETAQMIANNSQITPSDYHFNQAIMKFILGVDWLHWDSPKNYKRDDEYYSLATQRRLDKWKRETDDTQLSSLEARNLVLEPLTPDQELLLSLREANSAKDIKALMKEALPYHSANLKMRLEFENACEKWIEELDYDSSFDKVYEMLEQPFVSAIVADQIAHNINMMIDPFAPWNDPEAMEKYNEEVGRGEVN